MCCATRRLLSSNFGQEADEGSEVRTVSLMDNQCRFQTEEHCKVFITLLIGVSMVETLFTPVYGTVH